MKKITKLILILITICITTGCGISKTKQIAIENKGIELTKKLLENQGITDYEIISSRAHTNKSIEIWPDIYLDRSLAGTANVTIKYKGVQKDILAYCNQRDNEQALGMMKRYNERSEYRIDTEYCNTYDDILVCTNNKEAPNFTITKNKIHDSYNRVIDTYKINSQEKRKNYKVYIPINRLNGKYNNLLFLVTQIREDKDYTDEYPLRLTNDYKYYTGNFFTSSYEGLFSITESN